MGKNRTQVEEKIESEEVETHGAPQQEPAMTAEPQAEHKWLEKLVGEWTCEGEGIMEPGKAPDEIRRNRERAVDRRPLDRGRGTRRDARLRPLDDDHDARL